MQHPLMAAVLASCLAPAVAEAQQGLRPFVGVVAGVSTLSADARSEVTPDGADVSLYKPENGPAVNALVGLHVGRFFSVQANYIWNRNDLTLLSSRLTREGDGFYEQGRTSAQHAVFADALLYFRGLDNAVRPYLSTGVGLVRFRSDPSPHVIANGIAPPDGRITSTHLGLRVAVGIDLAMSSGWSFRYSFSEILSGNPVSARLMPAGERNLANFQNLFGLVLRP